MSSNYSHFPMIVAITSQKRMNKSTLQYSLQYLQTTVLMNSCKALLHFDLRFPLPFPFDSVTPIKNQMTPFPPYFDSDVAKFKCDKPLLPPLPTTILFSFLYVSSTLPNTQKTVFLKTTKYLPTIWRIHRNWESSTGSTNGKHIQTVYQPYHHSTSKLHFQQKPTCMHTFQ